MPQVVWSVSWSLFGFQKRFSGVCEGRRVVVGMIGRSEEAQVLLRLQDESDGSDSDSSDGSEKEEDEEEESTRASLKN